MARNRCKTLSDRERKLNRRADLGSLVRKEPTPKVEYIPTPEEIEAACAELRKKKAAEADERPRVNEGLAYYPRTVRIAGCGGRIV